MKKHIFYSFIVMVVFFLSGCGHTVEERQNEKYTDTITTEMVEMLDVGEELKIEKVSKGTGYSVLYETETGSLEWLELNVPGYSYFEARKSDREYSYLVRDKNVKNMWGWVPVFFLYLNIETDLEGGIIEESCGENCKKEIQNEIID